MRGKKIWLIGASEGIGRCLASALAREGAVLALTARQAGKLEDLSREFGAIALPADVQDMSSLEQAYAMLRAAWGQVDSVIYNAGYYEPMTAQRLDLKQAETMMDINFSGCMRVLSLALPDFISARSGHVVLVGSIAAYRGLPGAIGYGPSKAALLHLAESLAIELQDTGIAIQVVSPGFVRTRLTAKNTFAMPQIMEPEEAAQRIIKGMKRNCFEIRFPFVFSSLFKLFRLLPARLYFRLMRPRV